MEPIIILKNILNITTASRSINCPTRNWKKEVGALYESFHFIERLLDSVSIEAYVGLF